MVYEKKVVFGMCIIGLNKPESDRSHKSDKSSRCTRKIEAYFSFIYFVQKKSADNWFDSSPLFGS